MQVVCFQNGISRDKKTSSLIEIEILQVQKVKLVRKLRSKKAGKCKEMKEFGEIDDQPHLQ